LAFEPTKGGFDVSFGLDEDVDERAVVEILLVEVGRDATLVERSPFLDFFGQSREEVVVLDP